MSRMGDIERVTLRKVDWSVRLEGDEAVFTADGDAYRFDDMHSIGRQRYLMLDGHAVVVVDPIGTTRSSNAPLLVHAKQCLRDSEGA